ncbi:MAG TPA: type II toxin-antitoxin system YafQ family toxin [Prolixibacteraceae bacterium]|nr:type II toxin-antitoxin system YafQ family toxin [Prolixibacteraceae bacterium]
MFRIEITHQYIKDIKLARKRNFDESKLNSAIQILVKGAQLPSHFKNHKLSGNYKGLNECHITPDYLLIYSKNKAIELITLIRIGTHSDLFK